MENRIKAITAVLGLIAAVISSPLWTALLLENENSPPISIDISSNASNPIYLGSSIKFVARANDPDNDPIEYKFLLKGSSTNNFWKIVRDWSKSDNWIWNTDLCSIPGNNTVQVLIRDNKHSPSKEGDDLNPKSINFDIKPNNCPKIQEINFSSPSPHTLKTQKETSYRLLGATVVSAIADDPERDLILYNFSHKGPSTNYAWKTMKDWSKQSVWIWTFDQKSIGWNTIKFPFQTPIPRPALISTRISSFLANSPQQCNNHT